MVQEPDLEKAYKTVEFRFIQRFGKKPSLEGILLLIGFQESPVSKTSQSKEEKLDLINLGVLTVLSLEGYFERTENKEGWPEFTPLDKEAPENRELAIRRGIVRYFEANPI